jgi:tetraacyldisaccharide 4'-kinase
MALQQAWLRRGATATALWPVSLLYRAVVSLRRSAYRAGLLRTTRINRPVIVVGNVVAGGAGKTPVVIALVNHLRRRGIPAGVISRGYGRATRDCREVRADSAAADSGDEPLLIARATGVPVVVAPRRAEAARALLDRHPDVQLIVCDDGLQHLALARDLEICVFDARGTGNGWLLPAGPLREPWPRAVDFILHPPERAMLGGLAIQRRLASHAVDGDGRRIPLASLRGQRATAMAAIAQPQRFFDMLRGEAGIELSECIALPDHADLSRWQPPAGVLLCTEKDAVKLWPHHRQALAVPLEVEIEPAFWAALDAWLDQRSLSSAHGHQTD